MPESGRPTIGKSVALVLLLLFCAGSIATPLVCGRFAEWQSERTERARLLDLSRALAMPLNEHGPASSAGVQSVCDRMATHPSVLAAVVWDRNGRMAGSAVAANEHLALIEGIGPNAMSDIVIAPLRSNRGSGDVRRVDVPLAARFRADLPSHLALFVPAEPPFNLTTLEWLILGAPTTAAHAFLFLIVIIWFRRRVVGPVESLHTAVMTDRVGDARVSPTSRRDELGAIARSVLELHGRAAKYQAQAHQMERSLDSRVADETRSIQRDMKKIEREAWLDPLTGVNNRRMLDEKFGAIFEAQRRARCDMSIVMMDIDYFKTLNDTLGHRAGDEMLTFTGELIRQCLRTDDFAIRYGGDEFLLMLPGVSVQQARLVAGRIITLFAQRAKVLDVSPRPSLSAGVASLLKNEPGTPKEIIELADQALYQAKQGGKNTVRICENLEQLVPLAVE